jgi:hypothetical protein
MTCRVALVIVPSTALALAGCVIPGTSRGAVEPASVTPPPSLEDDLAQHSAPSGIPAEAEPGVIGAEQEPGARNVENAERR